MERFAGLFKSRHTAFWPYVYIGKSYVLKVGKAGTGKALLLWSTLQLICFTLCIVSLPDFFYVDDDKSLRLSFECSDAEELRTVSLC